MNRCAPCYRIFRISHPRSISDRREIILRRRTEESPRRKMFSCSIRFLANKTPPLPLPTWLYRYNHRVPPRSDYCHRGGGGGAMGYKKLDTPALTLESELSIPMAGAKKIYARPIKNLIESRDGNFVPNMYSISPICGRTIRCRKTWSLHIFDCRTCWVIFIRAK